MEHGVELAAKRYKKSQIVFFAILTIISLPVLFGQQEIMPAERFSYQDSVICREKFDIALSLNLRSKRINQIVIEIAKSFLGVDYAANTLEAPGAEHLIVQLQSFDCVTFYENVLVLARCIKKDKTTFEEFKKELQFVRYRGGMIDGYASRLHYTSDYFFDNKKKRVLKDVTKDIGGIPFRKNINFMSTHADSYPRLREFPEFVKEIQKIEDAMNARKMYHIPKARVRKLESHIQDGDILGITTTIEGLDCTHTGIAFWQNGTLHMIHAPIPGSKVQITEAPLWEYLAKIKKDAGIMVARPIEP